MKKVFLSLVGFFLILSHIEDIHAEINSCLNSEVVCLIDGKINFQNQSGDSLIRNQDLKFNLGPLKWLRWNYGPVSLGMIMDMSLVSISEKKSEDLLFSRIWQGLFIYPAASFSDISFKESPLPAGKAGVLMFQPTDFNNDNIPDLIAADRDGFLYLLPAIGNFPEINYEKSNSAIIRDAVNGLPFNIPQENPNFPRQNDLGGYTDIQYSNYIYPEIYTSSVFRFKDLIIGDGFGNLWWLPDNSDGKGIPSYSGIRYSKKPGIHQVGIQYQRELGLDYVKPAEKICDEKGNPLLLGIGKENEKVFVGANSRPVLYPDENGIPGLLVFAGTNEQQLFYLKRINTISERKPVFRVMGEVSISGIDWTKLNFHSKLCLYKHNSGNDLLLSTSNHLAILEHSGWKNGVPEFIFRDWIKCRDAPSSGYLYNEVLVDEDGKRYVLDFSQYCWKLIPVKVGKSGIKLDYNGSLELMDQNGIFRVEGETDPQFSPEWGYHRIAKWDFNGSGRQHLIVSTDKGLLYLLIDDPVLNKSGKFIFRSVGPLKDSDGNTIRVHNRAAAASIDINKDGLEDLLVGGISYQMGIKSDPHPGGGLYYFINKGTDTMGFPVLQPAHPIDAGPDFKPRINSHLGLQILDLDKDNVKEIILSLQEPDWGGRIFHLSENGTGLVFTGIRIPMTPIIEQIIDIDGDSCYDIVRPGDESGTGFYRNLEKSAEK